jgi:DNA-binding beta-propeller fold protein YncE
MIGLGALFFQTYGIAVSPAGANLYVTGFYSSDDSAPFGVVNTGLNKVVYSTTFSSSGPDSISVTPDGSLIYYGMVNEPALTAGTLDVISATNYSIVKTIQFANYPYIYTSFSPDGKYAYIVESASNGNSNLLTLYTSNYVISNTLSLPVNSITGAVTADGKYIYIPQNNNPGTITVVNTISDQLVATIDTNTGGQPQDVTLTPMFNTV